jgi:hypothetical protein
VTAGAEFRADRAFGRQPAADGIGAGLDARTQGEKNLPP